MANGEDGDNDDGGRGQGVSEGGGDDLREGRWRRLLAWLSAEHGMDIDQTSLRVECRASNDAGNGLYAVDDCTPSSTLFTIPAKAMINAKTLSHLYPTKHHGGPSLTAVELVSLHLLLHRPAGEDDSLDPTFGPFISVMPREFDSHPVTWTVRCQLNPEESLWKALCESLPPSVALALHAATARFWLNWNATCEYIHARPDVASRTSRADKSTLCDFHTGNHALVEDYLWAWLNGKTLNTRCIYYTVDPSPSSPSNFTLCPILDFANHAPADTHITPVLPSSLFPPVPGTGLRKRGVGGDYTFLASRDTPIHKDDELFLCYGAHANRRLLVEYGFVNTWDPGQCTAGTFAGEVDAEDIVEALFARRGDVGARMQEVLEEEGYWGDWTMHSSLSPAHPSYRLISALRLYHVVQESRETVPPDWEVWVDKWRRVLSGQTDIISGANETAWKATLVDVCRTIMERARKGVQALEKSASAAQKASWSEWTLNNIRMLWQEEIEVAEAVVESVQHGVEF